MGRTQSLYRPDPAGGHIRDPSSHVDGVAGGSPDLVQPHKGRGLSLVLTLRAVGGIATAPVKRTDGRRHGPALIQHMGLWLQGGVTILKPSLLLYHPISCLFGSSAGHIPRLCGPEVWLSLYYSNEDSIRIYIKQDKIQVFLKQLILIIAVDRKLDWRDHRSNPVLKVLWHKKSINLSKPRQAAVTELRNEARSSKSQSSNLNTHLSSLSGMSR